MKIFKIIIISNILIFLTGCNKYDDNVFIEGNIVGFVNLVNETGYELEDKSGVNISIEGLTNSASTNEDGRIELENVPAGTYNFIYKKPGYGIYKSFSYQFIGGNVPAILYETTLYEQPNLEVKSIDISFMDNKMNIIVEITKTNLFKYQLYISDSSNVSNVYYDYASTIYRYSGSGFIPFSQSIYLNDTPFSQGDKVYLVLYFINPYEEYGYYDIDNGKSVFASSIKGSNAISFIIE